MLTEEMKVKLFEQMLELEHLSERKTYDGHDYVEQSNGAYLMLKALGLDSEYIVWAIDR